MYNISYPFSLPVVDLECLLAVDCSILGEDSACCTVLPTCRLTTIRVERADEVGVAVDGGHPAARPTIVTTASLYLHEILDGLSFNTYDFNKLIFAFKNIYNIITHYLFIFLYIAKLTCLRVLNFIDY